MPEKGVFEKVYETIENTNPNWSLSHIRLMVRPSFSSTDENDWKRYVEINVFNMPEADIAISGNRQSSRFIYPYKPIRGFV